MFPSGEGMKGVGAAKRVARPPAKYPLLSTDSSAVALVPSGAAEGG